MTSIPAVSVGVPVYNGARYLAACLDSLRAQTFGDWNAVCVDDGSTDDSPAILADYARRDPRIRVVARENGGLSAARNTALSHMDGRAFLFLDADDALHPRCLSSAWAVLEGGGIDFVLFDHVRFTRRPKFPKAFFLTVPGASTAFSLTELATDDDRRAFIAGTPPMAWNRMVDAGFWRANDFRYPEGLIFEDNPVHWHMGLVAARYAAIPAALHAYRQTPGSLVASTRDRNGDMPAIYGRIGELLRRLGRYEAFREFWLARAAGVLYRRYAMSVPACRELFRTRTRAAFDASERTYLSEAPAIPAPFRLFFQGVEGDARALTKVHRRIFPRRLWYRWIPPAWREGRRKTP